MQHTLSWTAQGTSEFLPFSPQLKETLENGKCDSIKTESPENEVTNVNLSVQSLEHGYSHEMLLVYNGD